MFGFLKKKFSQAIESLSKKKEEEQKLEKNLEKIEEKLEKQPEKVEEVVEKAKALVEKQSPELREVVGKDLEGVEKVAEEKPSESPSLFRKLIKKITEKKLSESDVEPILNDLETGLIEGDVAYEVAGKIKSDLKNSLVGKEVGRGEIKSIVSNSLKQSLLDILNVPILDLEENVKKKKPYTILFLGFNGSGKTTTLAKVGKWLVGKNYSCVFAAGDTFRAASLEQLEEHAEKIKVDVIKHKYGADPAAVIFDAIQHAQSKGIHFVLADSAGRVHTNRDLLDEMKKIVRVNKPDLKVLVIDSMTGNDAVLQARMFNETGVDAVIFTKVDVNEKGGAILSVTYELKKPILFLCNGQRYEDIISFNAEDFVNNLVGG
ncbi:MAG: signal recognition particle-docking protein FtsY [Candidatus Aenigmarchaeota archaeon]|nr:signal recognition particle-docking protein FtsY [Candidatus Aenigmarchaeota archaeon]